MSRVELKSLDDLEDVFIVQKIKLQNPTVTSNNDSIQATQCLCFQSECDCDRNLLVEEQEAIAKKQLQMLQADERGKQALISEIAALKERQENRAELLRYRQHALHIEKERARKISSLPPPLSKSVKLLLKNTDDEPKLSKPDVQMPVELTANNIKPIESCCRKTENKENIIDPEELESRRKMHEEWDMKAKKRYYEALKKDRQKEEYSKILKQIQNAELLNRQEMAKNVSSDKKGMPCPLSDKFQTAKKQVDMEDATEKMFKKTSTKEHVIEDIEGYQDHYEGKYKQIQSNHEAKMIDCVPSFVKDNYDYLLEDESKFLGGKNFSGLDDSSSDILNQAYISTPPGSDAGDIDLAISHLDRLRSNLETEYEQNVKPLLAAAFEIPKKESKDKAVETESVRKNSEDKAVETDAQFKNELTSPSPTALFDFKNAGVMAYKRRPRPPILKAYEEIHVPDMHKRDVHYVVPTVSDSKDRIESWSSSSYCSLPSKHGIPTFPNGSKSAVCDICIAEMRKDQIKDKSAALNEEKNDRIAFSGKAPLSEYVQHLAKKHLLTKSTNNCMQSESSVKSVNDSYFPSYSNTQTTSPAFEKEVIGKSKVGIFSEPDKIKEFNSVLVKKVLPKEEKRFQFSPFFVERTVSNSESVIKTSDTRKEITENEELQDDIYLKINDNELHNRPSEYSEYELEFKRSEAIHQVLNRKHPRVTIDKSEYDKSEEKGGEKEEKQFYFPVQNEIAVRPHIYHELSTIHEADSDMTASSLQLSKLSDASGRKETKEVCQGNQRFEKKTKEVPAKEKIKDLVQSYERLKMVSLLDPPDTEITEIAKSIHFVPEIEKKVDHSSETSKTVFTNSFRDKSISSQEHLSTPTFATGSYSSVSTPEFTPSLPSSSSTVSIPSVESIENKNIQSCIKSDCINDLDVQSLTQSEASHPKQNKKDTMHTIISGNGSDLSVPVVSTTNISSSNQEEREMRSISGYVSDLEMPHMSTSNAKNLVRDEKDANHSIISGYISDLDVQQMVNSDISDLGQENMHFFLKQGQPLIQNSSPEGNFKLMTPHSNISSPCELISNAFKKDLQSKSRTENFNPTILHSSVPSSVEFVSHALKKDPKEDNSARSFKPMTPHSNVSSPSELVYCNLKCDQQSENIARSLKSTPSHSNVSSPNKSSNFAVRKDIQAGNSIGSFKALSSYSNISSPSSDIFSPNEPKSHINTSRSFKTLTSRSNISSPASDAVLSFEDMPPIGDVGSSERLKDKIFSENKPVMIRFHVSTDSLTSSTTKSKSSEAKHISRLNCNLTFKNHLSKPSNYSPAPQVIRSKFSTRAFDYRKCDRAKNKTQKRHKGLYLTKAKQYALSCSSDFFVPSMTGESLGNLEKLANENKSSSESTIDKEISNKVLEEGTSNIKSKEICKLQAQLERGNNLRKQYGSLQGLSSASSSSESLSVISQSKVVCQSTPIKNAPEINVSKIMQEPGILEEPDLTLQSNFTMNATEVQKDCFTSISSKELANQKKTCAASFSPNESVTPTSLSPQLMDSANTPSMLSFLQHEMICKVDENNSVSVKSPADDIPVQQTSQGNNTPELRDVKRSLFRKASYKDRTKRLWKNLEEVKKRDVEEERKKEMENNRRRAREFAKNLTPKQRRK